MDFTNQAGVDIILDPVGGAMAQINAEILGRDGTWVLYGLLGGGSVNFNLFNKILAKRAQIIVSTHVLK